MKFNVKQGDLTIEARYEVPAFALLRPEAQELIELLVTQLAPYGANPDVVFYNHTGPLGSRNVTINAPNINGGVKVFVAKAEAGFNDLFKVRFADIRAVGNALFESLDKVAPNTRYSSYVVSLNYHGMVAGMTHAEFIRQYTKDVPNLGPVTSTATGFYYGPKEHRLFLSVVMDGSVAYPNGLYLRIVGAFDGKKLRHAQLPDAGGNMLDEVLRSFNLEHELDLGK